MFRAPVRQKFIDVLECSYFGLDNYSVSFGDGRPQLICIAFIPNANFTFVVERTESTLILSHEAPGVKFLSSESFSSSSVDVSIGRLESWTGRIRDEVVSTNPFAKEISALRADLDQRMSALGPELDEFFTRTEAASLQDQLERFGARLSELSAENHDLRDQLVSMEVIIDDLKSATEVVNKGTWLRMSSGRLVTGLKGFAKSREIRDFALEAAKKFLLEGPK